MSEKEGDDLQESLLWEMLEYAVRWVHPGPVCTVALPVSYNMAHRIPVKIKVLRNVRA